ncbi:penicillin-binding protein [Candidatus Gracilibacteria bacterium]|nr:penicillin-binding protein [Candidatus Gracilibacteria bacterium]
MRIRNFRRKRKGISWIKEKLFHKKQKRFSFKKIFLVGSGLLIAFLFLYGSFFLPSVSEADQLSFVESTIIYDRAALAKIEKNPQSDLTENVLYVIHGEENREYLPLSEISPWITKATLAIEDNRFYSHFGFDVFGLTNAILGQFGIGTPRGGSTITQQLVKNTFLSRERTITRKFKEILLSIKMEWNYEKDDILELYLNKIPYGSNSHGIEAAAKTFFGKSSRDLTLAESVILASLPRAPTKFSPYGSNKDLLMGFYELNKDTGEKSYKKGRKDLVLERMLDLKMITFEQFKQAFAETKELEFKRAQTDIRAPHFVFYVREKLEEKFGKEFLRQGGLKIFTTLDPELQTRAEEIIQTKSAHYSGTYGAKNVALVSIQNETGEILSYVGGKDFFDEENDGQVDVLTSRRQPGSSFKPLTYATAFENGYTPSTVLFDVETDFGGNYTPQNFDGIFHGPVSARQALNESLNIPAVKMAFLATPKKILENAKKLGIKVEGNAKRHQVGLGLGVAEIEPLSHINSFQVFAGDGSWFEPSAILEIHNSTGTILEKTDIKKKKKEGLDPEIAALIRHILTDESSRPTTNDFDWNVLLQLEKWNNGAKTGTSNRTIKNPEFNKEEPEDEEKNPKFVTAPGDSWTIGFTPHLITGVWVGNNRGEPMKIGATGLAVAAPIWKKFMTDAHDILVENGIDPKKLYNEPIPLNVRNINKFSGKLSSNLTPPKLVKEAFFASFSIPVETDNSIKIIEIDKISGQPATSYTPFYARTQKHVLSLKSIRPDMPNWQSPVEEWLKKHSQFATSLGSITEESDTPLESSFSVDRFSRISSLRDDVHNDFTNKNPPVIKILSPRSSGEVARGDIEITVSVSARFGMKVVEFYFDDQLVADETNPPFTGKFKIPTNVEFNSKHTIRAVAIDKLLNYSEEEISVKITPDKNAPEIIFLGPIGNQKIPLNSEIQILAIIRDFESQVKKVEFFLDEQSLGTVTKQPFSKNFISNGKLGRHSLKIKAWDVHDNVSEKSIPVIFDREKLLTITSPIIEKIIKYRNSISIDLSFPEAENIEFAEFLIVQNETVLFHEKWTDIKKFRQFQIPRNLSTGKARVQLFSKLKENDGLLSSPEKSLEF